MSSYEKSTHSPSDEDHGNGSYNIYNQQALLELNEKQGMPKNIKDTQLKSGELLISNNKRKEEWTLMLFLCGLVTNFGACVPVGYSIGVLNTPQAIIRDFCNSTVEYRYGIHMGISQMNVLWSAIVSIPLVSGVVGSLSCSCMADRYGRKWTLFISLALATVAAVLLTCSRWALSVEMLLFGRLLFGFAGGCHLKVQAIFLICIRFIFLGAMLGCLFALSNILEVPMNYLKRNINV